MWDLGTHSAHGATAVLRATSRPGADVVAVAGQLEMGTHAAVRERILGAEELVQPRLLLDLTACDLLDSSGIGTLVQLRRALTARGTELELVTDSRHLRKLFRISALDQVLTVHDSVEAALDAGRDQEPGPTAS